jgi:hypothetical protein
VRSHAGASQAGDCFVQSTVSLKLLPPAVCVDAGGGVLLPCDAPGPADRACDIAGGVACADARGGDRTACTSDDLVPPAPSVVVPFTTGTALAEIRDAVLGEGICTGSDMNCITDEDCAASGNGICLAPLIGSVGPIAAGSGGRAACGEIEASNLAGLAFAGAVPVLDGAGDLGDSITTFTLRCE